MILPVTWTSLTVQQGSTGQEGCHLGPGLVAAAAPSQLEGEASLAVLPGRRPGYEGVLCLTGSSCWMTRAHGCVTLGTLGTGLEAHSRLSLCSWVSRIMLMPGLSLFRAVRTPSYPHQVLAGTPLCAELVL